jgi:hypothetical protein
MPSSTLCRAMAWGRRAILIVQRHGRVGRRSPTVASIPANAAGPNLADSRAAVRDGANGTPASSPPASSHRSRSSPTGNSPPDSPRARPFTDPTSPSSASTTPSRPPSTAARSL